MTRECIDLIAAAGEAKLSFAEKNAGRYLCRAAIAGFFIVVGTLISNFCGVFLVGESAGAAKIASSLSFSAALILIVLLGGELFTGANLVMSVSLYEKRVRLSGLLRVWLYCYIGNLLGIVFLCALVSASGTSSELLAVYIEGLLPAKLSAPWHTLLIKGILCNFLVCIGVFAGFRLKSEGGKALAIACVITTFVLAGFEHSIANMASFSLAAMLLPNPDFGAMLLNLLWVTLGNILGGAVLCALPLWLAAEPENA